MIFKKFDFITKHYHINLLLRKFLKFSLKIKILTKSENEISFLRLVLFRFVFETKHWKFYWNEIRDETQYSNLVSFQRTIWFNICLRNIFQIDENEIKYILSIIFRAVVFFILFKIYASSNNLKIEHRTENRIRIRL